MSNAVTSITAANVQIDLKSNINKAKSSESINIIKLEAQNLSETNSNIHETTKANSVGISSSPSVSSSSPTSSTSSGKTESPNQMSNHLPQHPNHPVQFAGMQYFQYPNQNSTTPVNVSPLSSMTSSPSTINTPSTANSTTSIHFSTQPHFFHPHSHTHQPIAYTSAQHIHAFNPNFKDTRWLTLEVCREFQRNKCNRTDIDCKFAHPPPHVEIVNGKVIACYDSLKGKCTRKEPPCKYLHPPQHLKDQLLQNGKNNLVLRQVALAMMQQQHNQPQTNPAANATLIAANPQLAQYATFANTQGPNPVAAGVPTNPNLIPTLANSGLTYSQVQINHNGQPTLMPMIAANGFPANQSINLSQQAAFLADPTSALLHQVAGGTTLSPGAVAATANGLLAPQQRTDRLLICKDFQNGNCQKSANECQYAHPSPNTPIDAENQLVIVCVDFIKGKCSRETCKYFHPPEHLVTQLKKQKISNNAQVAAINASMTANGLNMLPPYFVNSVQIPSPYRLAQTSFPNRFNMKNINLIPTKFNYQPSTPLPTMTTNIRGYHDLSTTNSNNPIHISATAIASNTANVAATASLTAQELNDAQFAIENAQAYQLPQYQIYPMYHRPINTNYVNNSVTNKPNSSNEENNVDLNKTASASATSNAAVNNANQVDVVPGKKRTHDAIEQDFIPVQNGSAASGSVTATQQTVQVKRAALTDSKTGMPVFHPYNAAQSPYHPHLHPQQHIAFAPHPVSANTLNYPPSINFPMQYAQYIPLPYTGHPSGIPRI